MGWCPARAAPFRDSGPGAHRTAGPSLLALDRWRAARPGPVRGSFALRGPFGPGGPVYSPLIDPRGTPRLYASSCNPFFGMKLLRSTDMGKTKFAEPAFWVRVAVHIRESRFSRQIKTM